jgi:quercetin dioxygenase-like cupin family protein
MFLLRRPDYKPVNKGVSEAAIFGDANKGAHATFTKIDPGQDNGMHTHTNDVWIVVLQGVYLYNDDAGEKRVGPVDFLRSARRTQTLEQRRQERRRAVL